MLFREAIQEQLLKLLTFWIPSKELRHKIKDKFSFNLIAKKLPKYYGDKKIYFGEDVSDVIFDTLNSNKPCLICRYGSNEFLTLRNYIIEGGFYFPRGLRKAMSDCAGFWPATCKSMKKFAKMLHSIAPNIDVLGVWSLINEKEYCLKYLSETIKFVDIDQINAIYHENTWTRFLKNKKVLVISPFSETIEKQYKKRKLLFNNPKILPEFELKTLKAIQSIGDAKKDLPFKDWFEALEYMKQEISKIDFDIAIIGCGAYGIFLGDYCKSIGKQAVHLGGATQLLFGIGGERWLNCHPEYLINANLEHWVRPSEEEKPKGYKKVEGGCYW